jgi:hypothetical protein
LNYIFPALLAVILVVTGGMAIAIKIAQDRRKKIKKLSDDLEYAKRELQRKSDYQNKREEAQRNADEKKESLHTGDDTADFTASIDMLHNASKK